MAKIKVLHLLSTSIFSGAENVACTIINSFAKDEGFDMVYCSVLGNNVSTLNERKIPTLRLENFCYREIRRAIKEYEPNIIHAHDIKSSIIASLFHKKSKIISHIHGNHENMRQKTFKSFMFKLAAKNITKIIWVSNSSLDCYKYKKEVLHKSIVLYNTIDSSVVLNRVKEDKKKYNFDAIYLGRLEYPKNPLRLIKIVSGVAQLNAKFKIAIVGTGTLENEMKKEVEKLHLNKNITFFGYIENPYKILSDSKVMLMTSIYEGTPMVALEAMVLGKPIISTPIDGMIDIIKNDFNGYLSNDDNEIIQKILFLTSNDNKINEMKYNIENTNSNINDIKKYKDKIQNFYAE